MRKTEIMKILKRLFDLAFTGILLAVAGSILITAVIKIRSGDPRKQANVFGYTPTVTLTGSMLPTIQIDALSIVRCCDISRVREGDIIVYYSPERGMIIIHRAVRVTGEGQDKRIQTKGDNNPVADSIITTKENFVGIAIATFNGAAPVVEKLLKPDRSGFDPVRLFLAGAGLFLAIWALASGVKYVFKWLFKSAPPPDVPGGQK